MSGGRLIDALLMLTMAWTHALLLQGIQELVNYCHYVCIWGLVDFDNSDPWGSHTLQLFADSFRDHVHFNCASHTSQLKPHLATPLIVCFVYTESTER